MLFLVPDSGGGVLQGLPLNGTGGSIGNSQCTITGAGSFASGTGNVLTLTLNITFSSAFGGNKIIYAAARSLSFGNSGWQALGTWSVPALPVVPVSALGVSPARGSGLTQHFAFTFTDANGATSLDVLNILMNDFLNGEQACYLGYSRSLNVL